MRYVADHDYHIHSTISPCCSDPKQTPQAILEYAKANGYKSVCLTNHFWDETVECETHWHPGEYIEPVCSVLPLPQYEGIDFLFGVEADMDYNFVLGISEEHLALFDFIVISTTHLGLVGNTVKEELKTPEEAADIWLKRLNAVLDKNLPWHKIGIAHLTTGHIFEGNPCPVIQNLSDEDLHTVFKRCAEKAVGIELNIRTLNMPQSEKNILLRPFKIAKECGCKFYFGSDSHSTGALKIAKENFEDVITELELTENDKFHIIKPNVQTRTKRETFVKNE